MVSLGVGFANSGASTGSSSDFVAHSGTEAGRSEYNWPDGGSLEGLVSKRDAVGASEALQARLRSGEALRKD